MSESRMAEAREETIEALAQRYHRDQDVEIETARQLAREVADHDALLEAAARWMATGVFPAEPEVAGCTPASLAETGAPPTTVFSLMDGLYTDPDNTLDYIRHDLLGHLDASAEGRDLNEV